MSQDPDRPTLADVCETIREEPELIGAVRMALATARRIGRIGSDGAADLEEALLDRLYDEHDITQAVVARDESARRDAETRLTINRAALDAAVRHHEQVGGITNPPAGDDTVVATAQAFRSLLVEEPS